jgi:hypothetical protein
VTREWQLHPRGEDPQRAALAVVDEHRLGEAEVVGDCLAIALRHLGALEEDSERVATVPAGGTEDAEDVQHSRIVSPCA